MRHQITPAETVTVFAAALVIPFYLGIIHMPVPQLLLYSGAASAAMTTGEFAETPSRRAGGTRVFVMDMLIWFGLIAAAGGVAYGIALIF